MRRHALFSLAVGAWLAAMAELLDAEDAKWAPLVRASGARAE